MNIERSAELRIKRGHLVAVLLANALLWAGAVLVSDRLHLGGVAAVALISIASLLLRRS